VGQTLLFLPLILCMAIFIRLFIFEIYRVPSESMENALFPGDYIVVNKLHYGPRLPNSPYEIPWLNLAFYLSPTALSDVHSIHWAYKRLAGFFPVKRGDIMVFKKEDKDKVPMVKRCLGLPGDTLKIIEGNFIINGHLINEYSTVKKKYKIWPGSLTELRDYADSAKVSYVTSTDYEKKRIFIEGMLNEKQKGDLLKSSFIDSITAQKLPWKAYPKSPAVPWWVNDMGPLVVPSAGRTIRLTPENMLLYWPVIKNEIDCVSDVDKVIYRNRPLNYYTFKFNYYFLVGDNRSDSNDSRFWGFVPEHNIEGKVSLTLYPFSF